MSSRHIRLSTGIDAFIVCMISEGPEPKRPPQMLLESDVRRVIFLSFAAPMLLLIAGCDRQTAPAEQAQEKNAESASDKASRSFGLESANGLKAELIYRYAGQSAPDATFRGADGREVALTDFAGRPLLVNLWATWCGPCKVEMPTLDALAELEAGKVTVIAVSQDLKGRKPVQAFFATTGIFNLEPYIDRENRVWGAIGGTPKLPTTILYNSEGREVWRVVGGVEWDDAEISALLAEAD
jgi:thiol-disulfide isomerase/thioredoxin